MCGQYEVNPYNCLVGPVLEFLQEHLPAGLTLATLKVDVATCLWTEPWLRGIPWCFGFCTVLDG